MTHNLLYIRKGFQKSFSNILGKNQSAFRTATYNFKNMLTRITRQTHYFGKLKYFSFSGEGLLILFISPEPLLPRL